MADIPQFDPGLKALLLRHTGSPLGEAAPGVEVAVVARLRDQRARVPHLRVVARFGDVVTARVPLDRVVEVRRHPAVLSMKASRRYGPALARSVPAAGAAPSALRQVAELSDVDGRGVILGVVDWGVDVNHANFRDRTGRTRLLRLWDQRGGPAPTSPAPFGYGREITREQIDAALATTDPYAALGYDPQDLDPHGQGTHGTHVLDIAAGTGRAPGAAAGVAPGADLIFVHLMADDTRPEDTLGDSVRILEAFRYIFDVAARMDRCCVCSGSFGRTGGPHDQTPLVTRGIDALVTETPGRAVVLSAGNYYDANLHTAGRVHTGQSIELPWLLPERRRGIAEIEVWYPGVDTMSAELAGPDGTLVARLGLGQDRVIRDGDRVLAALFHRRRDPNNGDNMINILLRPGAAGGQWTVRMRAESIRDGAWHAWIERTSAAEQSRFPTEIARNTTTIGTIAAGERGIAAAAFDIEQGIPAPFSSAGPTRDGRVKPDIAAPGSRIRAAKSSVTRPDGSRGVDELTVKSGTSMAAPHVAGSVALMFQAAAPHRLSAEDTVRILRSTALRDPATGEHDLVRFGAGRVNAAAACRAARAAAGRTTVAARSPAEALPESTHVCPRPAIVAATAFPAPERDGPAAARSALRATGLGDRELARFEAAGGLAPLAVLAARFGAEAFTQLLRRLRYPAGWLAQPPHTYGSQLHQRIGVTDAAELLVARVLLAVPGHFRELARTRRTDVDAYAVENLGWWAAGSLRDEVERATGRRWWLPDPPGFARRPAEVTGLGPEVRAALAAFGAGPGDPVGYEQGLAAWRAGLAGRQWALETGLRSSPLGAGQAIYPELLHVPHPVDVRATRTEITRLWRRFAESVAAEHPDPAGQLDRLTRCHNDLLPRDRMVHVPLAGLRLLTRFPCEAAGAERSVVSTLPVLGAVDPVVRDLFGAFVALGWPDLIFHTAGALCLRGKKTTGGVDRRLRAARQPSNHGFGLAIDLNVFENGLGHAGSMDARTIALFEAYGFRWGGCFRTNPDPMHFEYCPDGHC
ncbi:MAG TPA: S8 family serine peptidase [Actinophytocola sp.]|uniref:S8 family serine peptidase n=1 Tax=Actinophytocola sp. TaxID=1872138 RepID=UPI002DDD84E1|nr:S8 family serine peptidase [Actinophytocola sp.]HEV2778158.1 S8 family serine peptidase [Actinophytocola sp.]